MSEVRITGGCQCGAVRYALHEQPGDPHICHCRMCQKAFGSFFAPLTGVPRDKFEITTSETSTGKAMRIIRRMFNFFLNGDTSGSESVDDDMMAVANVAFGPYIVESN